jgi:hypothetical protein
MAEIPYPKYENLAALLAEGQSETEAVRLSGFSAGALDGIKAGPYWGQVIARVDEIRAERQIVVPAPAAPVDADLDPTEMTPNRLMKEAWKTYVAAAQAGMHKPALSAIELIGKFKGHFVQRKEITFPSLDQMPTEQLEHMLLELDETEYSEVDEQPDPPPAGFSPK